jgi:superfamily I DNA and RNA helicase
MEFVWSDAGDNNAAERLIWTSLKKALVSDEGVCYHRYPIFSSDRSRREPDILMLHRQMGLYVIETKGCRIHNIERINGQVWVMKDWHSSQETPYAQAEDQMFSVLNKFKNESRLRKGRHDLIQGHVFIGLPLISKSEWREKGLHLSPASPLTIIFADDLEPNALRARLQNVPAEEKQETLTNDQWELALSVLQGAPTLRRELRPEPKKSNSKAALLREVEAQMMALDKEQEKVAIQIPIGPQRIRGLAGSGKTVVMCMKAAWMHLKHPNWNIAYTFYTKSLYAQIKSHITRFYRWWTDGDPDWTKIQILHGWGGKDLQGMYRLVAHNMNRRSRTYSEAKNIYSYKQYSEILGNCCRELRESDDEIPQIFDAILIDEAQDFNFEFYKLCYTILREPKRLIWAYDEVQSLESLAIPTAIEIFGTYSDGSPIVDLEDNYPDSEVEKDMILYHCYRTPRPILVTAHIFGMGLLRPEGAVQFIPTVGGWEDIGYEIISGEFKPGKKVTVRRPEANSPNLLEKLTQGKKLVECKVFTSVDQEIDWVTEQIYKNIQEDELKPDEIVVISLDPQRMSQDFVRLQNQLGKLDIDSAIVGIDTDGSVFRKHNHITLTGIFRAKGNEASVVYVIGFEEVGRNSYLIVQERNQAFTAMTRARGWCILTGIGDRARTSFKEIEMILSNYEQIAFTVPDPKTIQRNLDNLEYERRRNRLKKGQDLTNELARVANEIDDPEIVKKVAELQELMKQKLKGSNSEKLE